MRAQLGAPLVWVYSALTLGLGGAHQSLKVASHQVGFCAEMTLPPSLSCSVLVPPACMRREGGRVRAQLGASLVWVFSALTLGLGAVHRSLKAASHQVGFCAEMTLPPSLSCSVLV